MRRNEDRSDLPRIKSTCEHGLPKLLPAERWLKLGENEASEAAVGGLVYFKGELCIAFFAAGVYRAMPLSRLVNEGVRSRFRSLFTAEDRAAIEDYTRRNEAGEWRAKSEAVWASYQHNRTYEAGF